MTVREIHVTEEMLEEARRLGLTGTDLVMAAIKTSIERETPVPLDEGIRFVLPDGRIVETDGSWPPLGITDAEA